MIDESADDRWGDTNIYISYVGKTSDEDMMSHQFQQSQSNLIYLSILSISEATVPQYLICIAAVQYGRI